MTRREFTITVIFEADYDQVLPSDQQLQNVLEGILEDAAEAGRSTFVGCKVEHQDQDET